MEVQQRGQQPFLGDRLTFPHTARYLHDEP
jgi:hypothetical protein